MLLCSFLWPLHAVSGHGEPFTVRAFTIALPPDSTALRSGDTVVASVPAGEALLQKEQAARRPFYKKIKKSRKLVAVLLAFPFPFGIVGLHRIYLGTKPYVPVAYIASLGGVFGILPLIDFFVILFDKDFPHYENNGKVFMWIR